MGSALVSLIFLAAVIVIANVKKINVGFVAAAAAMLLGLVYNLNFKDVISGFNAKLLVQMFAMQLLVVISAENGTLKYIAGKIQRICRGQTIRLFPFILYILMLAAEVMGFNLYSLLLPVLAAVALALHMDVLKVAIIGIMSMLAGCFSPYSFPGILLYGYAAEAGVELSEWNIPILCIISYTVLFLGFYFLYGWHKAELQEEIDIVDGKMNKTYFWTICAYIIMVVSNIFWGIDIAISCTICSLLLFLFQFAKPEECLQNIPYAIMLMMAGMSMLISVCEQLGGIELFSLAVTGIPNKMLAPAAMTVLAAMMSIFTSASTVVQPTLISALPHMLEMLPGVNAQSMIIGIAVGSYAVATGPFDASGAQIMAAYGSVYRPNEKERMKTFNSLIKITAVILLYQSILSFAGFYRIQIF